MHPHGWRISLGLASVPAILMLMGGLLCPETPNSLVEQGRLEEARRILERIRGTHKVDAEFQDLVDASKEAQAIKHPFRNLLTRKYRPQFVIGSLAIPAFQQLTGNNSILFYAPVIFQSLGFGSGASLFSSLISSGALLIGTLISMFLVDKFGRRKFFLEAGAEMITYMVTDSLAYITALSFLLFSINKLIDLRCAGGGGCGFGRVFWAWEGAVKRDKYISGDSDIPVCVGVWKIVGSAGLVGSQRAVSIGDKVVRTERGGVCEHDLHGAGGTVLPRLALPSQVWHLPAVWGLDCLHELCGFLLFAGD